MAAGMVHGSITPKCFSTYEAQLGILSVAQVMGFYLIDSKLMPLLENVTIHL